MMYSDYIQNGGTGIIKLLADNQALSYLLSDDITALDSAFLMDNGSKTFITPEANILKTNNDLTPLALMMKVRFGKKWVTLYHTIPSGSDPLAGEVTTSTGSIDSDNTNTSKVAGYDSDEMVDDNANTSTGSNKTSHKTTKTSYLDLTKLLYELKNNVFYDMLFSDIRNYMFVTVYGNERTM